MNASHVIIFSADRLRTGITQKVLKRAGIESLSVNRILAAREAIVDNVPRVVIFDTKGISRDEINSLRNLCRFFREIAVIVLGDRSIVDTFGVDTFGVDTFGVDTFEGEGVQEGCCLADPFDPELIASKVKEILSSKAKEKRLHGDGLESDLKQFLKLD